VSPCLTTLQIYKQNICLFQTLMNFAILIQEVKENEINSLIIVKRKP
jgi:hypothetical protein